MPALPRSAALRARSLCTSSAWPSFLAPPTATDAIDILYAESEDILLNLATEEYLFEHVDIRNPLLLLWRNRPCIIIGKHQNPWKECRVQLLEQDGVTLARRPTGGGCVYRDLGATPRPTQPPHIGTQHHLAAPAGDSVGDAGAWAMRASGGARARS